MTTPATGDTVALRDRTAIPFPTDAELFSVHGTIYRNARPVYCLFDGTTDEAFWVGGDTLILVERSVENALMDIDKSRHRCS